MLGLGNSISASQYPGGFSDPTSLSGLQLWLKNDTGITTAGGGAAADGDLVHGWADSSGNGNDATASSQRFEYIESEGGILSTPALGNSLLNLPQLTLPEFSIFMKVKFSSISSGATDILALDKDSAVNFVRIQNATQIKAKVNNATPTSWTTSTTSLDTYYTINFNRESGVGGSIFIDGVQQDDIKNVGTNSFLIDRIGSVFNGVIKNFVVYDRSLTQIERKNVRIYVQAQ
tara:strand:+ start:352 stop:1047 length:696 start_codon:yes stop_codon:yes gene_type:complete